MKRVFLVLGLASSLSLLAQDTIPKEKTKFRFYGGFESNSQWYVKDPAREIDPSTDPKFQGEPVRSNNYLPLNLNYGKFTAAVQVESYVPMALLNFSPKYEKTNLGTYFLNYKSERADITAGHFYDQFGSGLLLRSWEERPLGINNAIRGGRINYKPTDNMSFTGLYGRHRTGFEVGKGDIYGFNTDINLSGLFKMESADLSIGGTYVGRYEKAPEFFDLEGNPEEANFDDLTSAYTGRISFIKDSFYISSEYNYKSPDAILGTNNMVQNDLVKPGNAVLMNFGYARRGFGLDVTLRRMENMTFLSERNPEIYNSEQNSLYFNDRIMNFIPSLTKQHHFNLANIYVYQAQPRVVLNVESGVAKAGETGGQFDLFYEFKKGSALGGKYGTKVAVNGAAWFNLKGDYDIEGNDYTTDFFGHGEKYFSDYNIEVFKRLSSDLSANFVYINQFYNNKLIAAAPVEVNTDIVATELVYKLPKGKSVKLELEHMWADSDRNNWAGMVVEYNHSSRLSFYASDMYNYGFDENSPDIIDHQVDQFKIHFYNVGTAYTIGSTRLALSYGRQRGGLVCAGGVCRYVPPSTGLSLSVNTSF